VATRSTINLVPIFRTNAQWLLLTHLFVLTAEHALVSTAEVARAYRLPQTTLNDEVRRCVDAGLIREHRSGRTRFVEANWGHATARPLSQLLALTCGPLCSLGGLYSHEAVRHVAIFGSYARRYLSEPGPFPHDVDVAIVVHGSFVEPEVDLDLRTTVQQIGNELGVDINPWIVPATEWDAVPAGSVLEHVKSEPIVEVRPW
jgi:hypothetical protein